MAKEPGVTDVAGVLATQPRGGALPESKDLGSGPALPGARHRSRLSHQSPAESPLEQNS